MLLAVGVIESLIDLAKIPLTALFTYLGARLLEGYKTKEARRDAAEARRQADERADRDRKQLEDQRADSQASQKRLQEMLSHLTSQIVALRESQAKGRDPEVTGKDVEIDTELGISPAEPEPDDETPGGGVEVKSIKTNTGTRILWLEPPLVESPRYVHFHWKHDGFKIRDFMSGRLQQHQGATRQTEAGFDLESCSNNRDGVWSEARERLQIRAELIHVVEDYDWWKHKLTSMTKGREFLNSPARDQWSKDRIIQTLDLHRQRATYGALAKIVGAIPHAVMEGREPSQTDSWIVAVKTVGATNSKRGWPTGYPNALIHPDCLRQIHERLEDFIAESSSLMGWLANMADQAESNK